MNVDKMTLEALEKAYQGQIIKLYEDYQNAITVSGEEEIDKIAADSQFNNGLELAQETLKSTMSLAGIE